MAVKRTTPWRPPELKPVHHTGSTRSVLMLVYGAPGTGKTSFARDFHSENGKSLILALDANAEALMGDKYLMPIGCWRDFEHVANNMDFAEYDSVAVDTVGQLMDFAEEEACRQFNVDYPEEGPGRNGSQVWHRIRNLIGVHVARLARRAGTTVFLSHEETKEIKAISGRRTLKIVPDLRTAMSVRMRSITNLDGRIEIDEDGKRFINFAVQKDQHGKDTTGLFDDVGHRFDLDGRKVYDRVIVDKQ